MKRRFQMAAVKAALFAMASLAGWGQDAAGPASSVGNDTPHALGDVARQTRARHTASAEAQSDHAANAPEGAPQKAPSQADGVAQVRPTSSVQATAQESDSQSPSLADLARQTRMASRARAKAKSDGTDESGTPTGYQLFALEYCQNPVHCSEATVAIPEKAEVVSKTNGQYIFRTPVDGQIVLLYAGPADVNAPYRSLTDPDYARMREIGSPNGTSHEKADRVHTQELTVDGKYSVMTRFRYQRDPSRAWIGERVLVRHGDAQFLIGCTAPEDRFSKAESVCITLVDSLRLP